MPENGATMVLLMVLLMVQKNARYAEKRHHLAIVQIASLSRSDSFFESFR